MHFLIQENSEDFESGDDLDEVNIIFRFLSILTLFLFNQFEESAEEQNYKSKVSVLLHYHAFKNKYFDILKNDREKRFEDKPYDEAYEVSQDLSVAESYDGRNEVSSQDNS